MIDNYCHEVLKLDNFVLKTVYLINLRVSFNC